MTKRVVIVRRACHEFTNQLWSDMSIYAYALAVNARVWNLAKFETGPLALLHTLVAHLLGLRGPLVQYTYLPPTIPLVGKFVERPTVYFFGWLFRNPAGLKLYRKELLDRFGPSSREESRKRSILASLPQDRRRIGVQVRTMPLKHFPDGEFLVSPDRVREIVLDYLRVQALDHDSVALVLVSDRPIRNLFKDFAVCEVQSLDRNGFFLLAACSVIIGTNTSYCNLAAWFGDVPHVVTTAARIDWAYYRGHQRFFDNKYASLAFGSSVDGL